jgi:hypothetical protein
MSKDDKSITLHPLTTLARIRRGETALVSRKIPVLPTPILPNNSLVPQLDKLSDIDVSKNRIATWWNRGQVEQVTKLTAEKLLAARNIQALSKVHHETYMAEITAEARTQVERLLLHNQTTVISEATAMAVSPQEYSQYSLARLQAQLQVELKELQVKADLRLERATLEETYKAILAKSSVEFDKRKQLIDHIAQLETDLENVDSENLAPTAKRNKKRRLKREIENGELELASKSQTVQAGNGRGPRQRTEESSDSERPAE